MRIYSRKISLSKIIGNKLFFLIFIITCVVFGVLHILSSWSANKEDAEEHAFKMAQAAQGYISPELIYALDVSTDVLSSPEYQHLKNNLFAFKEHIEDVQYAYLYTVMNGKVYIIIDSEPENAGGYAPQHTEYAESDYINPFFDGNHTFTKPTEGQWGTRVSALIPIKDTQTGKAIAVFGVDFSAAQWNASLVRDLINPFIIVFSILLLFTLLYRILLNNISLKDLSNKLTASEVLFRTVFKQAPIGIAIVNNYWYPTTFNIRLQQILGRTEEELKALNWMDVTHPDDLKADLELFDKFRAGEINGYDLIKRYQRKDGSYIWVHLIIARLQEKDNSQTHICIIQDINEFVLAEEALRESERSKSVLLSNLPGMAYRCCYDQEWTMHFLSDGCYSLTGYKPEALLHNHILSFSQLIAPEYREELWDEWNNVLLKKESFREEYEIITAAGERKWVLELGQGIFCDDNQVVALEGIIVDISESKRQNLQIQYMNDHDFITGLYNRKYYENAKILFDNEAWLPIAIIIADINGLRLINDAFGHSAGDHIIIETSKIIHSCIREGDTLSRTGGDEFSILLPNTDRNAANDVFCAIKRSCDLYNQTVTEKSLCISLSIGYGIKTMNNRSIDEAEKEAEDFMIKRKLLERKSYHNSILSTIMATMYTRSQETEEHAERLFEISKMIAEKIGLSGKAMDDLQLFSMLHDIGKVGIDDRILNKSGKLTNEEWVIMKKHPELGYRIAMTNPELESIAEYILSHHERWDGKGYPSGLSGENIPLLSRILAIADAYDAMTEDRVYRKAMGREQAFDEIKNNSGTQFDPMLVDIISESILYIK